MTLVLPGKARDRLARSGWLNEELRLIRPRLVIPVGRLAIDRFLGPLPLHQVVGKVHTVEHPDGTALCVPLPHPSGASSWIHEPGHPALLDRALGELRTIFLDLGIATPDQDLSRRTA